MLCGAVCIGFALSAAIELMAIVNGTAGGHATGSFAFTLLVMVAFAVFGLLALHHEHVLRNTAAQSGAGASAPSPGEQILHAPVDIPHMSLFIWRHRSARNSPVAATFIATIFVVASIGAFIGIFITHTQGARSHLTQRHGIASTATVVSVTHVEHTSRYSSYDTATIDVTLPDGSPSTVHDPQDSSLQPGQQVGVLTDPKDSGYSELPGQPSTQSYTWIFMLLLTGAFTVAAGFFIRGLAQTYRMRRSRQEHNGPAPSTRPEH